MTTLSRTFWKARTYESKGEEDLGKRRYLRAAIVFDWVASLDSEVNDIDYCEHLTNRVSRFVSIVHFNWHSKRITVCVKR